MRWITRLLFCVALVSPPMLVSSPVQAQSEQDSRRAMELFKESRAKYQEGDFQGAVALLKEAYSLKKEPVLLYNLGRAYDGLGDYEAAIKAFTEYLSLETQVPDRKSIETRIETLKKQINERDRLRTDKEAAEERERTAKKPTIIPWIVAGVGAAGLASGAVFGLIASSHNSRAEDASTDQVTAADEQDQAKTFATVANISFAVGGALAATGLIWGFIVTRKSSTPDSPAPEPKAASIMPLVGPGGAGLRVTF